MIGLSDIVGQREALRQIGRLITGSRLPHAMLFVGPRGVGRHTTATALAATLLCRTPARLDSADSPLDRQACGKCEDCRLVAAGTHPDMHYVYKELAAFHDDREVRESKMQELGIGVVRQFLIAPAYRAGTRGRGKVFIVSEADLLSDDAQNALLKTLEEPPPDVRIILVAENTQQMLPTTVSRCSVVRFSLLPQRFVAERLSAQGIAAPEAAFWAALTGGSIGESMELSAMGLYGVKGELLEALAAGGDLSEPLEKAAEKLSARITKQAKDDASVELSALLAKRRSGGIILRLLASAVTDALACRVSARTAPINADQPQAVEALAKRFQVAQLSEIIEQLDYLEQLLWRNVNPKTVWENVAITCLTAAPLARQH